MKAVGGLSTWCHWISYSQGCTKEYTQGYTQGYTKGHTGTLRGTHRGTPRGTHRGTPTAVATHEILTSMGKQTKKSMTLVCWLSQFLPRTHRRTVEISKHTGQMCGLSHVLPPLCFDCTGIDQSAQLKHMAMFLPHFLLWSTKGDSFLVRNVTEYDEGI